MDLIRRYFLQVKTALAGMTVSQKLLIGLLSVILLATVFWTVVGSSKPDLVTLVSQSMTPDQIAQAEMALKGKYEYQVSGDRILVPLDKAYQIRGDLGSQGLLPRDLSTDFDAEIQKMGLLSSEAQNERQWMLARQKVLTKFLLSFPYVQDGSVIVSVGQPQSLGRAALPSTATVNLKTKGNVGLTSTQVQAVAETVSGAVSGMKREDVHVIVNGQPYRAPSSDTPLPANLVEYKKAIEDYLTTKLMAQFSGYGDLKISVNVVPDLSSKTKEETLVDPKNVVSKPLMVRSQETSSTEGGSGGGGEPGVKPNTGIAVSDTTSTSTGRGSGSTSTVSQEENKVVVGQTTVSSRVPAGVELKDLTASISLPRSYFVSVYRNRLKDPKAEPKDQAEEEKFQTDIIGPELKKAMALAKNVIGAKEDQQVKVDWYDDSIMMKIPDVATAGTSFASGTLPMITQYAKQGLLAVVALGALGMMLRMVKRAVPAGAEGEVDSSIFFGGSGGGGSGGGKKAKKKGGSLEQLDAAEDIFGEANQGEAVLTGIELDDETLASRKMVDEVSAMIKDNPENAAALVKRWMTKNK